MQSFEFFCCFVELNLSGLSFGNFPLKFISLSGDFYGEFFNLKGKLFNLGFICSSVFLKSKVILLLLSGRECPLLQLFLIPVHFKFELVHFLVGLEDHVLNIV